MMIVVGAWVALIGYGILYAGIGKLGGQPCGLRQAFSVAGCQLPASGTLGVSQGSTLADQQQATAAAQTSTIPNTVLV
jgi:hypothetical protein